MRQSRIWECARCVSRWAGCRGGCRSCRPGKGNGKSEADVPFAAQAKVLVTWREYRWLWAGAPARDKADRARDKKKKKGGSQKHRL